MKLRIAITGALERPRSEVAALIGSTENGQYVASVTLDTHYLVCTNLDSKKARKAARLGTSVISEAELNGYIASGAFPDTALPLKPKHVNNFPEIVWDTINADLTEWVLGYTDAGGNSSIRRIAITGLGHSRDDNATLWIGGYEGSHFKTWRRDRMDFLCRPEDFADLSGQ